MFPQTWHQLDDRRPADPGYDLVAFSGWASRVTLAPRWNNPGDSQEPALPLDFGAELFGPGDLIVARLYLAAIDAYEEWVSQEPMSMWPGTLWRARRKAFVQEFRFANMDVLHGHAEGPTPAELVVAARSRRVAAVLFEEGGRDVLALVNFRIARDADSYAGERLSSVPSFPRRGRRTLAAYAA